MTTRQSSPPFDLGHVHLKVRTLTRAVAFYTEIFELEVTEQHPHYAFLSWGVRHHDVALQEIGSRASEPEPSSVGLYHAAFEVQNIRGLVDIYHRLLERDVRVSQVDHGISKALYFRDPSGNGLEVYLDTRAENDQPTWDGVSRRFDPDDLLE